MVDAKAVDFVRRHIEERDPVATKLKKRFPFRLLADHCRRASMWAERICAVEGGDAEVVALSALFHDIGKCEDNTHEGHAIAGARICGEYLASAGFDEKKRGRIVEIVRNHIHHAEAQTLEARIESDADLLDETGALTVLWDAMAVGGEDEQSYEIALARIRKTYDRIASDAGDGFHTAAGRRFYGERVQFLAEFLKNLEWELGIE